MTPKEEFIQIYKENITRKGADELLEWLQRTDFFTAPASARYHCACEGKAQFYKVSTRNVKNEQTGQWEKVPYFAIEDQFPYGHGEKSVFLIERKMRLKIEEAMAIRWHMGEFGDKNSNVISQAYDKYPLAVKLHLADLESTFLREKGYSQVK